MHNTSRTIVANIRYLLKQYTIIKNISKYLNVSIIYNIRNRNTHTQALCIKRARFSDGAGPYAHFVSRLLPCVSGGRLADDRLATHAQRHLPGEAVRVAAGAVAGASATDAAADAHPILDAGELVADAFGRIVNGDQLPQYGYHICTAIPEIHTREVSVRAIPPE